MTHVFGWIFMVPALMMSIGCPAMVAYSGSLIVWGIGRQKRIERFYAPVFPIVCVIGYAMLLLVFGADFLFSLYTNILTIAFVPPNTTNPNTLLALIVGALSLALLWGHCRLASAIRHDVFPPYVRSGRRV